jgi:hypothetical protein
MSRKITCPDCDEDMTRDDTATGLGIGIRCAASGGAFDMYPDNEYDA